jgi:hypothetical protein
MAIPEFLDDGFLPIGVHLATELETVSRFGTSNPLRQRLMADVAIWLSLARTIKAVRFLIDGSFVTAKPLPNDVDCVVLTPRDFDEQVNWGRMEAVKLYQAARSRKPGELFIAPTVDHWDDWVGFFGRTRDGQPKGMIEVIL